MNDYHPFLDPLWRRIALVALVACWAAYEVLVTRDPMWMTLAVGMLAYGFWAFIVKWAKPSGPADSEKSD